MIAGRLNIADSGQHGSISPVRPLRLICWMLLLILCGSAHAMQSDTTRNKYPLNDPRNPDCPCHQYQRIADEEYRSGRSNNGSGNAAQPVQHQLKRVAGNAGDSSRSEGLKKKRKGKFRRMNYFKKRSLSGYRGIKKFSLDSASCFRWQT